MILGTPRRWWIATGILALAGIILIVTKAAGDLSIPLGILLLFIGMAVFAAAPMRYGQGAHAPSMSLPTSPPPEPASPPPLAEIEAGDSSEV